MRVKVRFFAGTRDAVGAPSVERDVQDGATLAQLLDELERAHPRLAPYRAHALLAVDGAFVPPTTRLRAGAEVAIMPPVSGGEGLVLHRPFAPDEAVARLSKDGAGAVVAFYGHVRGATHGARVERLRFEAYEAMAEQELARVRDEAKAKFGLVDCVILHRVGDLAVAEPIVAVATAAPHRRAAFEAAMWAMDELKTRVPIWKQEIAPDGAARWVNDPTTDAR